MGLTEGFVFGLVHFRVWNYEEVTTAATHQAVRL